MLFNTTSDSLAIAALFALALATPLAPTSKFLTAPFAPGCQPYDKCGTTTPQVVTDSSLASPNADDCLQIATWANSNNGIWDLGTGGNDEWTTLNIQGSCAVAVDNKARTNVGNVDVHDLVMDSFHLAGTRGGGMEYKGNFACQGEVTVDWWLRISEGM
ncbi:uncharacterized protein BCR38DRAFT_17826 [Pseudomassariella vexata]|uniref:Ecp2 effector protein-like domain-containing protein n=1 Tax=Pseudomassariella vexata TaxID=1141098 RepID=A0A1Y2EK54_9PEZI|nr:uncharacterized protein BCR38DRAFT_17826 [Pseudomassariella vexata]ORY71686.1 hypothetical protein BCR38DRAFT_17826 [Pseudomassariella vexata]